jgi:hypothetical protein
MIRNSIPGGGWEFFSSPPRPERLWSPPSLYPMVPESLSLEVKWPGREADHSPPLVPRSKNEWSYTSTPPVRLHSMVLDSTGTLLPFIIKILHIHTHTHTHTHNLVLYEANMIFLHCLPKQVHQSYLVTNNTLEWLLICSVMYFSFYHFSNSEATFCFGFFPPLLLYLLSAVNSQFHLEVVKRD